MKKIALLTLTLLLLLVGTYNSKTHHGESKCTTLEGPSSVSALNTHFDSQDHLNEVFEKWLKKFDHRPTKCEYVLSDIDNVVFPSLHVPEIIYVELEVFNKCEKETYTHIASFELVVLEEELRV